MSLDLFTFYNDHLFISLFNEIKHKLVLTKTISKKLDEKPYKTLKYIENIYSQF